MYKLQISCNLDISYFIWWIKLMHEYFIEENEQKLYIVLFLPSLGYVS